MVNVAVSHMHVSLGVLPFCAGSAVAQLGGSMVYAAVKGPHQAPSGVATPEEQQHLTLRCVVSRPPFAKKLSEEQKSLDSYLASTLRGALESVAAPTPRQAGLQCDVLVEVASSDPATDAATAFAAAMAALIHAGVECTDVALASSCVLRSDGSFSVDETAPDGVATLRASFGASTGRVLSFAQSGNIADVAAITTALDLMQSRVQSYKMALTAAFELPNKA